MFEVPSLSRQYDANASGVDTANQYAAKYSPWRRAKRWWMSIFLHFFHVAVVNAYMLYSVHGNDALKSMNFGEFRQQLALELTAGFHSGRGQMGRPRKRPKTNHKHEQIDAPSGGGVRHRGRCSVCCRHIGPRGDQIQVGNKTSWRCALCDVWVCHTNPLCWPKHVRDSAPVADGGLSEPE
jgi:hypothetical protein